MTVLFEIGHILQNLQVDTKAMSMASKYIYSVSFRDKNRLKKWCCSYSVTSDTVACRLQSCVYVKHTQIWIIQQNDAQRCSASQTVTRQVREPTAREMSLRNITNMEL